MSDRGFVSTMRIVRNQAELTGGMVKPSAGLLTVDFDVPLTMAGARVHRVAATLLVTTDHEALKRGVIKVVMTIDVPVNLHFLPIEDVASIQLGIAGAVALYHRLRHYFEGKEWSAGDMYLLKIADEQEAAREAQEGSES